jgi:hypothetical protein
LAPQVQVMTTQPGSLRRLELTAALVLEVEGMKIRKK